MDTSFDTLEAARKLEAAGMERKQAEAVATVISHGDRQAATKADLDTTAAALRADIASLEARLTWRFIGALITVAGIQTAILIAVLRTFG